MSFDANDQKKFVKKTSNIFNDLGSDQQSNNNDTMMQMHYTGDEISGTQISNKTTFEKITNPKPLI